MQYQRDKTIQIESFKGLIVEKQFVDDILNGVKTWDMRATNTSIRGMIAIIEKGSSCIIGVVEINDSIGPMSSDLIEKSTQKHQIKNDVLKTEKAMKWKYAWVMSNPKRLKLPVPYLHPRGAVIWVNLSNETRAKALELI